MDDKEYILGFSNDGRKVDYDFIHKRLKMFGCDSPTAASVYHVYKCIKALLMLDKLNGGMLQKVSYTHLIPMLNKGTDFKSYDDMPWQAEFDVLELADLIHVVNSHVNAHKSFIDLVKYEDSISADRFQVWFESIIVDHRPDLINMMAKRAHENRIVGLFIQYSFARANDQH